MPRPSKLSPLDFTFFQKDGTSLARDLLGQILVRRIGKKTLAGKIVETEAYSGLDDMASHAYGGQKNRNAPMFGEPGLVYVYFTYGSCFCFNIVCGQHGHPDAVLVRALEPLLGIDKMQRRRGKESLQDLCSGPGKLCQALGIDKRCNAVSLLNNPSLFLAQGETIAPQKIATSPRIGLSPRTGEWRHRHLRFFIKENTLVSRKK